MRCKTCREDRPAEHFAPNPKMKTGRENECRQCRSARRKALRHQRRADKAAADQAAAPAPLDPAVCAAMCAHLRTAGCQACHDTRHWEALRLCFMPALRRGTYQPPTLTGYTERQLPDLWRSVVILCANCLASVLAPAPWLGPAAGETEEPLSLTEGVLQPAERPRRFRELARQPGGDPPARELAHVRLAQAD